MDRIKKFANYLIFSSLFLMLLSGIALVLNKFYIINFFDDAVRSIYSLNFIVANTDLTFDQLVEYFGVSIFVKDVVIAVLVILVQLIFLLIILRIKRKGRGYIALIIALIFHVATYGSLIINKYVIDFISIDEPLLFVGLGIIAFGVFLQTILLVAFTISLAKELGFSPSRLFARENMLDLAHSIIKFTTIILVVGLVVVIGASFAAYQVTLIMLSRLSLENYFDAYYQYELFADFVGDNKVLLAIVESFSFDNGFIEIQNSYLTIDVYYLNTYLYELVVKTIDEFINPFIVYVSTLFIYLVSINILNYIHKKTEFKHGLVVFLLTLATIIEVAVNFSTSNISVDIGLVLIGFATFIYIYIFIEDKYGPFKFAERLRAFYDKNGEKVASSIKNQASNLKEKIRKK